MLCMESKPCHPQTSGTPTGARKWRSWARQEPSRWPRKLPRRNSVASRRQCWKASSPLACCQRIFPRHAERPLGQSNCGFVLWTRISLILCSFSQQPMGKKWRWCWRSSCWLKCAEKVRAITGRKPRKSRQPRRDRTVHSQRSRKATRHQKESRSPRSHERPAKKKMKPKKFPWTRALVEKKMREKKIPLPWWETRRVWVTGGGCEALKKLI